MMRLVILTAALGLGFLGAAEFGGRDDAPLRKGLTQAAATPPKPLRELVPESSSLAAGSPERVQPAALSPLRAIDATAPMQPQAAGLAPAPGSAPPALPPLTLSPAAPAPVGETPAVQPEQLREVVLRYVSATAVNVREGPSTNYAVIDRVTRGEAVELVETNASGWARIRVEGDGIEGWMSSRFLVQ